MRSRSAPLPDCAGSMTAAIRRPCWEARRVVIRCQPPPGRRPSYPFILIMRDGAVVQVGTPAEVVAQPADDYVRDFVSDVPRSHVITLRYVMRDPQPGDSSEGPVMAPDTIVRQAAQAALASDHPVRVVEDGALVGIVDDDAILRVVVAEEEAPA